MVRRTLLKGFAIIGACAFFLLDGFKFVRALVAGQVPSGTGVQRKVPITSVRQAIQANDPDEIVKFVLSHPRGAESASVQEKIQMLKILNENGANCIAENQQAAFIILKNEENHPASLAQIADGVGPQRIEKNIRGWTNADLKRIAAKGIGSSKSRGL
jgi:hypothetical protein